MIDHSQTSGSSRAMVAAALRVCRTLVLAASLGCVGCAPTLAGRANTAAQHWQVAGDCETAIKETTGIIDEAKTMRNPDLGAVASASWTRGECLLRGALSRPDPAPTLKRAVDDLRAAVELLPSSVLPRKSLALALRASGNPEECVKVLDQEGSKPCPEICRRPGQQVQYCLQCCTERRIVRAACLTELARLPPDAPQQIEKAMVEAGGGEGSLKPYSNNLRFLAAKAYFRAYNYDKVLELLGEVKPESGQASAESGKGPSLSDNPFVWVSRNDIHAIDAIKWMGSLAGCEPFFFAELSYHMKGDSARAEALMPRLQQFVENNSCIGAWEMWMHAIASDPTPIPPPSRRAVSDVGKAVEAAMGRLLSEMDKEGAPEGFTGVDPLLWSLQQRRQALKTRIEETSRAFTAVFAVKVAPPVEKKKGKKQGKNKPVKNAAGGT